MLSDESVNNEQAKVRAEGMRRLGRLYSAAADTSQGGAKKRAEKHKSAMNFMATGGGFGGEKYQGEHEHHEYGDATEQSDIDESRGASNVPVTVRFQPCTFSAVVISSPMAFMLMWSVP